MTGWSGAILLLVALVSCGQSQQAAKPDFRGTLSRGGGFTGITTGYHLTADGTLTAWRRSPGQDEQVEWSTLRPAADARSLAEALHTATRGWHCEEAGNMTTRLRFRLGDSVRTWTWSGTSPPTNTPEGVTEWLQAFDGIARQDTAR